MRTDVDTPLQPSVLTPGPVRSGQYESPGQRAMRERVHPCGQVEHWNQHSVCRVGRLADGSLRSARDDDVEAARLHIYRLDLAVGGAAVPVDRRGVDVRGVRELATGPDPDRVGVLASHAIN